MPLRCAIAWRRKLSTETPGISSGCWKPRNRPQRGPLLDREVGDVGAVEQDPAAGDRVGGVAEQRVGEGRLPEPLGPIRAWSSPGLDGEGHARAGSRGRRRRRGGRRSRARARRGGRAAGSLGHGGHCNNTTAVVEIKARTRPASTCLEDRLVAADHRLAREEVLDPAAAGGRDRARRTGRPPPRGRPRRRGGSR